jgi:hypothetical protein
LALWPWNSGQPVIVGDLSGAVSWSSEDGRLLSNLQPGARLGRGTLTVEGAASFAQLVFQDDSTVTLVGDSEMTFTGDGQKRFVLRRGLLVAEVSRQPSRRPMQVRTAAAEVEVLGTRFSLAAQPGETSLAVSTGKVQMRRLADGNSVEVSQAQAATATLDTATKLDPRPLKPASAQFRQTFDQPPPPAIWQGQWVAMDATGPGRLRNVPDVSARRADGSVIVAYAVSVRDNPRSIASVQPESVLRLRFRTAGRQNVMALVGLQDPTGEFVGNFQTVIKPDAGHTDAQGWWNWEAPLSSLQTCFPKGRELTPSGRVFLVFLACHTPKANLEVAEVAIEPPSAGAVAP